MSRLIDRRRFLQVSAGAAGAAVAYGVLGVPGVRSRPEPSARRVLTKEFHLGPAELAEGSRAGLAFSSGGLKVGSGHHAGHVLSPVLKSDLLFDYVGLFWSGLYPEDSSVAFWVRTSTDGRSWSPWETVHVEMPPGPLAEYDTYGALIWADRANFVQFLGELRGSGKKPELHRVGLTLLNPYDGPPLETASDSGDGGAANTAFAAAADSALETEAAPAAVIGKPITFKREDWGADESLRFSAGQEIWPRSYVPTKKLIVHHTVTGNSYASVEDAKALIRAIYVYHASSLGWGDIGYNSLVDKFGYSYEGRRGRDGPGYDGPGGREILSEDVVGGHALIYNYGSSGIALLGTFCTAAECSGGSPTAAMVSRLEDVLTWECQVHGINPQANSDFLLHDGSWHYNLPNIVGHRDVAGTTCPGGNAYALLPQLRGDVAARLDSDGVVLSDGTLLQAPGTAIYVMRRGLKRGVRNPVSFEANGFEWGDVKLLTSAALAAIPTGDLLLDALADGNLLSATGRGVFVMEGGVKRHIINTGVFSGCGYGWDAVQGISVGRLDAIPRGADVTGSPCPKLLPSDGSLVQAPGTGIYVMQRGLKRGIRNPVSFEANGFQWGNVNALPESVMAAIASGQPLLDAMADGNLLSAPGRGVFVMEGGFKRHIINTGVFSACGYGWDAVQGVSVGRLDAIAAGSDVTGSPCPKLLPPDGTLVAKSGGGVHLVQRGLKRHVPNVITFEANGFQWGNVNALPESVMAAIASGQPLLDAMADGNLLSAPGRGVFVMEGGVKRHIINTVVFSGCGYGWDAVQGVSVGRLDAIAAGSDVTGSPCPKLLPPDGTLVAKSGGGVHLMQGGVKRLIPNVVTFEAGDYQWGNVNALPESVMAAIASGQPLLDVTADGNLLSATGRGVFVMEGGFKRHIINTAVFSACGYGWDAVQGVSVGRLDAIARGADVTGSPCPKLLPPDGTLLQDSTPAIYVMEAAEKRLIGSDGVFTAGGYSSGNVNPIADSSLASIPTGDDLAGEPCP